MAKEFTLSTIIQVLDKATTPLKKIGQGFGSLSVNLGNVQNQMTRASESMIKAGNNISGTGKTLMAGITLPILGMGTAALKTFGNFEMMTANFTTMFEGNEVAAKKFLSTIEDYANVTPYTTEGLAKNAQTMMQFGMSSENTMKVLKQLGDISGGNTDRMNSLSLAFAQVSSAGKLQGQDLLQMVNAGFNPLQVISKKTGKSMAELKDIMSKGGISAEAVGAAFKSATEEGGLFYKGADRGSKTLNGLISTLKDTAEKGLRMLGETSKESLNLSTVIPQMADRISKVTAKMQAWIKENPKLTAFIIKMALALAAIGPLLFMVGKGIAMVGTTVQVITGIVKAISFVSKTISAISAVLAANPIMLIIIAIALAVFLIYKYWEPIKKFFKKLWENIKTIASAAWNGIKSFFIAIGKVLYKIYVQPWIYAFNFLKFIFGKIKAFFMVVWEGIKKVFKFYMGILYAIYVKPFIAIYDFMKDIFPKIKNVAVTVLNSVIEFFKKAGSILYDVFVQPFVDIYNKIIEIFDKIKNSISNVLPDWAKKKLGIEVDAKINGKSNIGNDAVNKNILKPENVLNSKNQTEITVKVEAEDGTIAKVNNVKSKGAKPKISSAGFLGNTYNFAR
jgi:tape measure domain-containing protein